MISKEEWNQQYARGKWDYLQLEKSRHAVIKEWCELFPKPTLLDIGCGFAQLAEMVDFSSYVGIDISEVVLQQVPHKLNCEFQCLSAETFTTSKRFNIILFNEVLYYLTPSILIKYERFFAPGGVFIISMWKHPKTVEIWDVLAQRYQFVKKAEIRENGNEWIIALLKPLHQVQEPKFQRNVQYLFKQK